MSRYHEARTRLLAHHKVRRVSPVAVIRYMFGI